MPPRKKIGATEIIEAINRASSLQGIETPQAVDLEEVVLGAILLQKTALIAVKDILHEEVFYDEKHRLIYKAINQLDSKGKEVDILTVTHQLRSNGDLKSAGGPLYVSQITNRVASTANISAHARIIVELYMRREMYKNSLVTQSMSYDVTKDIFEIIDYHNQSMSSVINENVKEDAVSVKTLAGIAMKEIEERQKKQDGYIAGMLTGIDSVDNIIGGWKQSDFVVVAARPSMGKTAYLISAAINQAKRGIPVAIFSLEMSKQQLLWRFISQETQIDLDRLMNNKLSEGELEVFNKCMGVIEKLPIHIDDTPALSIFDLRAKATRMKAIHGIEVIYLDYLQLCTARSEHTQTTRDQEIGMVSRTCKVIAKELNVPFIALAQLSRAVEARGGSKRPQLSDIRESGQIEQDCDVIGFLYRAEYYKIDTYEDGTPSQNTGELIIAKNRNGSLGIARMNFIKSLAKYEGMNKPFIDMNRTIEPKPLSPNTGFEKDDLPF